MKISVVVVLMWLLFAPANCLSQDWHSSGQTMACPELSQMQTLMSLAKADDAQGFGEYAQRYSCVKVPPGKKVYLLEESGVIYAKIRVENFPKTMWVLKKSLADWGARR